MKTISKMDALCITWKNGWWLLTLTAEVELSPNQKLPKPKLTSTEVGFGIKITLHTPPHHPNKLNITHEEPQMIIYWQQLNKNELR